MIDKLDIIGCALAVGFIDIDFHAAYILGYITWEEVKEEVSRVGNLYKFGIK